MFIPKARAEELVFDPLSTLSFNPITAEFEAPSLADLGVYDLDLLAKAVSVAETSGCTDGTAIKRKNCFGIMRFWLDENGNRQREPKYYASHEESFADFKRIWAKFYKKFPDRALATKWTGNDSPDQWLSNVCSVYPHPSCL